MSATQRDIVLMSYMVESFLISWCETSLNHNNDKYGQTQDGYACEGNCLFQIAGLGRRGGGGLLLSYFSAGPGSSLSSAMEPSSNPS